jgi:zinc protease
MPDSARTVRVPFDSSQTHVLIGQPVIARGDPDYYPLYVANQVLGGGGLVSVLAKEMREKRGLSYSTYSAFMPAARKGRFELGTQVRNSALGEARKVLTDTLASFRKNGPTEQQLQEAKQNITGSFPLNLDSNRELVRYVAMIGFYGLPLDYLDKFRDRIETLTRQQVADAFRRRVDPARMVTVLVGPADVIADKGSD